jgi:hypothetical protein
MAGMGIVKSTIFFSHGGTGGSSIVQNFVY